MNVNGGDTANATTGDYIMHFLTFGFKVIAALHIFFGATYYYYWQTNIGKSGESINVAILRRIGNLKNTHVGAHRRGPRQETSELRFRQSSDVWVIYTLDWRYEPIHQRYGPYIRAPMFKDAFQRMTTFIRSPNQDPITNFVSKMNVTVGPTKKVLNTTSPSIATRNNSPDHCKREITKSTLLSFTAKTTGPQAMPARKKLHLP